MDRYIKIERRHLCYETKKYIIQNILNFSHDNCLWFV